MVTTQTRTAREYELHKEKMADVSRAKSRTGRDIGPIPPVRYPKRKSLALRSFRGFLEEYFPERFTLEWGEPHLKLIERTEQIIRSGGCHSVALPRGWGKSTTIELAPSWASFIGARRYVFFIGNSEPKAEEMLESVKMELMYNQDLLDDFPEVCYPIRMLEGQPTKARGQLHHGDRTDMKWGTDEIRLPTIHGSPASGATIKVAGLTGNIRGAVKTLPGGKRARPDFVILDDPQTDESARSPAQCEKRIRIVNGGVMGLKAVGSKLTGIMPCTVIQEGDLSDTFLDRKKSPDWTGERTSMMISFPTNDDLWDQYALIRHESLEQFGDIRLATKFYVENREAMDAGAEVSWEEAYNREDEISAIQSAMNLKFYDERAFWAEYQNKPLPEVEPDASMLTVDEICAKTSGHARGVVPIDATKLVAHIDVQGKALYYALCAFADNFTGYLVDYGAFPKQKLDYFTLRGMKYTLQMKYPKKGFEGCLYAGLDELVNKIAGEWKIDGGGVMRPSRILIDAAWGKSSDTVFQFARQSKHASIITPAIGRYIGASSQPMNEYQRKRGERVGHNWRIPNVARKRAIRHVLYDTNYWKSFVHSRLCVSMGDPGSLSLFEPRVNGAHRMIAEQLTAEQRFETEGRGRKVDEWKLVDKSRDNHLFDDVTGCMVAASMEGVTLKEIQGVSRRRRRKRVKLSEVQARKRGVA